MMKHTFPNKWTTRKLCLSFVALEKIKKLKTNRKTNCKTRINLHIGAPYRVSVIKTKLKLSE